MTSSLTVLGYDPGGGGAHGGAVISRNTSGECRVKVQTLNNVHHALNWFAEECNEQPTAAGIDTLLAWPFQNDSGWRCVDTFLRGTYPDVRNSVVSANSLYGAMCVNGMSMAFKLREKWSGITLNETHPKVLYYALTGQVYHFAADRIEWLIQTIGAANQYQIESDNEWDALISAWFTLDSILRGTPRDLLVELQNDQLVYPLDSVHYYWT
jgi:hypothetical protein